MPSKSLSPPACHPEKPYYAKGLCVTCYVGPKAKGWRTKNPDRAREISRRCERGRTLRRFGLDEDKFDALVAAQEGRCAICRQKPGERGPGLVIDHDHQTNKFRGLLCDF